MILFALLLLIVILVILILFKSSASRKLYNLEQDVKLLKKYIAQQSLQAKDKVNEPIPARPAQHAEAQPVPVLQAPKQTPPQKPAEPLPPAVKEDEWESGFKVTDEPAPRFKKEDWLPKEQQPAQEAGVAQALPPHETVYVTTQATPPPPPPPPLPPPKPTFFERNPDLEKFVGENLVSKIGIAILVLAIGFFVKYAIDNDWIGAWGRVSIGLLCGGILVGIAHRLRSSYQAFSSVLVGGGLAIFYFTITLAYQQFQLFGQTAAFVIMLVITAFAVLLSLLYNRQELAVIALVGGFASPFLVSNGSGNYITLFVYLVVLNTGLLIIAYRKAWRVLNTTAFIFTAILFATWLMNIKPGEKAAVYANGLLFATIFYLLFLFINIAHNIKERKQFIAFDFGILLSDTCLFFGAGLYCLNMMKATGYNGLFSAAMGVFNLGITYFLFRRNAVDKNILYLLIGITLTFVSLTAPLQLHAHFITLFWASEAVLLYWLFAKSKISVVQYASAIVYVAMMVSLLMDWQNVYWSYQYYTIQAPSPPALPVIFNKGFITTLYAALASYILFRMVIKYSDKNSFIPVRVYKMITIVLLYASGFLEISYQFTHRFAIASLHILYLQLYTIVFLLALLYFGKKSKYMYINYRLQTLLLLACAALYLFFLPASFSLQHAFFSLELRAYSYLFAAHWVVALLTGLVLYRLVQVLKASHPLRETFVWLLCGGIVFYLSIEVYLVINNLFFAGANGSDIDRVFVKVVLPVLWGLCSFAFMWLGMRHRYKTLRIISLSLFALTLIKLFAYDISNIPVAGKIAAFFCLGVLLLIISFMYQRLKKIIIEDEARQPD